MDKKHQLNLTYIAIAFGLLLLFQFYWVSYTQIESVPYSRFQQLLKDKEVTKVVVGPSQIQGEFKTPQDGKKYFTTTRVDPAVASELQKHGIEIPGSTGQSLFRDILSWVLPIIVFFAIWAFFVRRMAEKQGIGGLMNVGRSREGLRGDKNGCDVRRRGGR